MFFSLIHSNHSLFCAHEHVKLSLGHSPISAFAVENIWFISSGISIDRLDAGCRHLLSSPLCLILYHHLSLYKELRIWGTRWHCDLPFSSSLSVSTSMAALDFAYASVSYCHSTSSPFVLIRLETFTPRFRSKRSPLLRILSLNLHLLSARERLYRCINWRMLSSPDRRSALAVFAVSFAAFSHLDTVLAVSRSLADRS